MTKKIGSGKKKTAMNILKYPLCKSLYAQCHTQMFELADSDSPIKNGLIISLVESEPQINLMRTVITVHQ